MRHAEAGGRECGMTLVEVTMATAIFAVASVAAAHLLVWAIRALYGTGAQTIAVSAAQARMEDLQSLAWRFDPSGNRISDLAVSPANTLTENVDGYVYYLDERGDPIAAGAEPPSSAAFVRRWAIRPLASAPDDTVVLQVLVLPLSNGEGRAAEPTAGRGAGESLLTTARTRMR